MYYFYRPLLAPFISNGIVLFFLLTNTIISDGCVSNGTNVNLPANWPCEWNDGIIAYTFNYYSLSPRRLISIVKKGLDFLEERSCLKFIERDPIELSRQTNFTYLFYSYSDVLETCCLQFFTNPHGRRQVLITPICTLPAEVAHTTLHAMGLSHPKQERFSTIAADAVLFPAICDKTKRKNLSALI